MKPKKIKQILNEARKAGSVHLTGTREERKAQLKAMRLLDMGDNCTDEIITGNTSNERKESLRNILKKQKGK